MPSDVRVRQLALGGGPTPVVVPLHPRLTVVTGLAADERARLADDLLGALSGTRRDVVVEVDDDAGRRLVVTRGPSEDGDAVHDGSGADLTAARRDAQGRVDLLAAAGVDAADLRRRGRLTAADVEGAARADALLASLARCDQATLWALADRVAAAEDLLGAAHETAGGDRADARLVEQIEARHLAFEASQARLETVRRRSMVVMAGCAAAGAAASPFHLGATAAAAAVAAATLLFAIVTRLRKDRAARLERAALAAAGDRSYQGFHLRRVHELLEGQAGRERLTMAAAGHRDALAAWHAVAGEAEVEWAMDHKDAVLAAHRRLATAGEREDADLVIGLGVVEPVELAGALVGRLADLRHAGIGGESVPLVLDDPFSACEPSTKQWLLELLCRTAGAPQCAYLTDDPDVAAWARMEAAGGADLAVVALSASGSGASAH